MSHQKMVQKGSEAPHITKRIEPRKPHQVTVDLKVQRPLDPRRVKALADDWSDLAMGVPTVSQRVGGECIALDGQHRWEALKVLGRGNESFQAMVYRGLSLSEEAKIFRLLNSVKKLTEIELFLVAVVEKVPDAVACAKLLDTHGLTAETGKSNSFRAVKALRDKYNRDVTSTDRAIQTAVRSWGRRRQAADGRIFEALADIYFRYGDLVNLENLVERLRKGADTSPDMLIGRGRSNAQIRSISVSAALADVIVNVYNYGRRRNVLPSWE